MTCGGVTQNMLLLTTNNDVHAPAILVLSRTVTFVCRATTKNRADDFGGFITDGQQLRLLLLCRRLFPERVLHSTDDIGRDSDLLRSGRTLSLH